MTQTHNIVAVRVCGICFKSIAETNHSREAAIDAGWYPEWWLDTNTQGTGQLCVECCLKHMAPLEPHDDGPILASPAHKPAAPVNVEITTAPRSGSETYMANVKVRLDNGSSIIVMRDLPAQDAPRIAQLVWDAIG